MKLHITFNLFCKCIVSHIKAYRNSTEKYLEFSTRIVIFCFLSLTLCYFCTLFLKKTDPLIFLYNKLGNEFCNRLQLIKKKLSFQLILTKYLF